ncbi:hypothetical protein BH23THE1_BH23THE1_31250 [soil metagenome]
MNGRSTLLLYVLSIIDQKIAILVILFITFYPYHPAYKVNLTEFNI